MNNPLKEAVLKIVLDICDKYSCSVGEAISASIPTKASLAMAQDTDLMLWFRYFLINGRRIEL